MTFKVTSVAMALSEDHTRLGFTKSSTPSNCLYLVHHLHDTATCIEADAYMPATDL